MAAEKEYAYLDLLDRKLDAKQRAACCRTENTIVAAGAGSGKTQVLATRFAWLVMSEDVPVSQILTLTFTRKAAAEMYERIYRTLSFFAGNPETPPRERERAARAVADFSEAHIQTLDSYRAGIVGQAANRYGIRPDFASDEDKLDLTLLSLEFVLKKLSGGTEEELRAIRHFAGANGMQDFAENFIAAPVKKYASLATEKGYLSSMPLRQLLFVKKNWNSLMGKLPAVLDEAATKLKGKGTSEITALEGLCGTVLSEDAAIAPVVSSVKSACFGLMPLIETSEKKPKAKFEEIDFVVAGLYGLACYMEEYPFICGLYSLLDEFTCQLNRSKRLSGQLLFKDIADMAMKVLIEQEDIRSQEKAAYSKIMIDEFQDNNGRDRDLLFLLAEREGSFVRPSPDDADSLHQALKGNLVPDKLFFVGDEKQSIYKFRGADVSVFNELKDDLGSRMLQMNNNYRSVPELLSCFNQLFGGFLPSGDDCMGSYVFKRESQELFEATYPSEAQASKVDMDTHTEQSLPPLTEDKVRASVCMFNSAFSKEDKDGLLLSTKDQTAYFVARQIRERHDADSTAHPYSSFAVLDRSRSNRAELIRWLNVFGIPYSLDQQGSFFLEAPVNDIYAMLRLCVYPSDRKAFAAVLASPFIGLSDVGVQLVLAEYAGSELWNAFAPELEGGIGKSLSPEEFGRYKEAAERFAAFRDEALQEKICRTLDRLWNASGYRYNLLVGKSENLLSEHFDLLFEMARKGDEAGQSLAWFVDQLGAIRDKRPGFFKVDSDDDISNVEYPVEKLDSVSVMTIHKSKGLQFRHVFVLGCCGNEKSESIENFFFDDDYGLSIRLRSSGGNPFFARKKDELNRKEEEEFKRIFYVAVTRAEEDVCIVGDWKETKNAKAISELPMMQRIVCSYYEDAKSISFQTGTNVFVEGAPFFFQSIAPVSKADAFAGRGGDHTGKTLAAKLESVFAGEPAVAFDRPASDRMTPHSLETKGKVEKAKGGSLYPSLGPLLNSYGGEIGEDDEDQLDREEGYVNAARFDSASFGTVAHSFLEAWANGMGPGSYRAEDRLFKDLTASDRAEVCRICEAMLGRFASSPLGKRFSAAKGAGRLARSEYAFRMYRDGVFYTGCIDLLFEEEAGQDGKKRYVIVDYKTDSCINRERYRGQLECYRAAAARMLNVAEGQVDLYLYFLRFDEAVEL
ncbi:MAG: UvrD-helicase domain-containing protein [Treponema sp.]|nr:UvrD-helicase domain-containing protein [Treponema sp.]